MTTAPPARPFVVVLDGAKHREWGQYRTQEEAQAGCAALLRHGLLARIASREIESPIAEVSE